MGPGPAYTLGRVDTFRVDHGLRPISFSQGVGAQEVQRTFKRLQRSEGGLGANPCGTRRGNAISASLVLEYARHVHRPHSSTWRFLVSP